MKIKIREEKEKIFVFSPYNTEFVSTAKSLNGRWHADTKEWGFNADLKTEIENVLYDIYGYGGELVNVVLNLSDKFHCYEQDYAIGGRVIATRRTRDSKVRLDESCAILGGGFESSHGSVRNPIVGNVLEETEILMREFPKSKLHEIEDAKNVTYKIRNDEIVNAKYKNVSTEKLFNMMAEIEREIHVRVKNMRSNVMSGAWKLYKEEKYVTFSECLKESWKIQKK